MRVRRHRQHNGRREFVFPLIQITLTHSLTRSRARFRVRRKNKRKEEKGKKG